jgi:hypothetical protein
MGGYLMTGRQNAAPAAISIFFPEATKPSDLGEYS